MNYNELISNLKKELSSKIAPGPILDGIMFDYLEKFGNKYDHNHDLLMIGALIGDIRIDEARAMGDKSKHIELAYAYAQELFKKYSVPEEDQKIISEVILTHHGGEQNYIESKIYKNADNFKFLETRGCLHFFGAIYTEHTPEGLAQTVEIVKGKLKEKLDLTDLDEETIAIAEQLYNNNVAYLDEIIEYK